jgi:hypothetical protein
VEEYIRIFQPSYYLLEEQPNFSLDKSEPIFRTKETRQSLYARAYAIDQIGKLCLSYNKHYSHIVFTRPDLYWLKSYNIHDLSTDSVHVSDFRTCYDRNGKKIPLLDAYRLFLEENITYKHHGHPIHSTINDLIFVMNMQNALLFMNMFNNIQLYIEDFRNLPKRKGPKERLSAHPLFFIHMLRCGFLEDKLQKTFQHFIDFSITRHFIASLKHAK